MNLQSSFSLPQNVRILPALIITLGVVLSLRAAATARAAEGAQDGAAEAAKSQEAASPKPAAPAQPAPAPASPAQQAPSPGAGDAFAAQAGLTPNELSVLQSLGARRELLDGRERALSDRSALVEAAEKRLEQRVAELKQIEAAIQALIGKMDAEQETRTNALVSIYQKMRAKDAAAIFDALDQDVLVAVASRMKDQSLAEILGLMQPAAARRLTTALAQAKKLPEEAAGLRPPPNG